MGNEWRMSVSGTEVRDREARAERFGSGSANGPGPGQPASGPRQSSGPRVFTGRDEKGKSESRNAQ